MEETADAIAAASQRGDESTAPSSPPGAFGLLVSWRFGPLFATQFLSAFNDNALRNALVLMIAYRADVAAQTSAQIMIPLAAGLFMLPFFLCSATAGQIADELDKASMIRLIKLIEIPVMLMAAGGVLAGSAAVLLALLFTMGIVAAFFGPLKYAILPDLLAPEELLPGNALVEAGTYIAILLGTIAGMLIATRHGSVAVAGLIVTVALAAWVASWKIPRTTPAACRGAARWDLFAATVRVTRQAAQEPGPFRSILGISWFWLAGATYLSQFPAYVRFILGAQASVVTLFLTLFSVGIAFGSLLCNRLLAGRLSARCVPWGALGIGLFSIDLWLANPPPSGAGELMTFAAFLGNPLNWRILADLFGIAASGGVFVVPLYALLQAMTEREHRARAIAANNIVNAAAMVISSAATMALIAIGVGIPGLFLLTGAATLAVAVQFWRMLPRLTVAQST